MAGVGERQRTGAIGCEIDEQALDRLGDTILSVRATSNHTAAGEPLHAEASGYAPFIAGFDTLGRNALLLSKTVIRQLVTNSAYNYGMRLLKAGAVHHMACDGELITADVDDHDEHYQPTLDMGVSRATCRCREIRPNAMCCHVAALMLAWNRNIIEFLPSPKAPSNPGAQWMSSTFGRFVQQVTGHTDYPAALARLCELLSAHSSEEESQPVGPQIASGVAYWPQASLRELQPLPLRQVIEQEYNAAQLRELAHWLSLKPKGTTKSTLIDQVVNALQERVRDMWQNPGVLLEGLSDETAAFARKLLTARDYQMAVPRNLAHTLWTAHYGSQRPGNNQATGEALDKAFAATLDELRRRAILFPTLRRYDYRDVFYQWITLDENAIPPGGNLAGGTSPAGGPHNLLMPLPLIDWPVSSLVYIGKDIPDENATAGSPPAFLDTINLFLNAVLATGSQVRASLPRHPRAGSVSWLKDWEHDADEAEQLFRSRPGWAPHPQSGIAVPLEPWLSAEAISRLEDQTGLPASQCSFLFDITAALQLIEAPDPYDRRRAGSFGTPTPGPSSEREWAAASNGHFVALSAPWHVNARLSTIEGWYSGTDVQKYIAAFDAWQHGVLFGHEAWSVLRQAQNTRLQQVQGERTKRGNERRAQAGPHSTTAVLKVMRSISASDFMPLDLSAEWCALRRFVVRALRSLPSHTWVDWPAFRRLLFDTFPGCLWQVHNLDMWWFSEGRERLDLNQRTVWDRTIGAMIEAMLAGPLRWFGVVETMPDMVDPQPNSLPQDGPGGLCAFRTTEALNWLAHTTAPLPTCLRPKPQQAEPITWLDDTQWRLPPAPDRAELIALAHKIAEPAGARFIYRLTPASLERALSLGVNADDAARLFELFGAPMPEAAQQQFRSIAERFGRVRVYESLSVLELADDYALRELLASTSLRQHIVYQISPRAVVVDTQAVDTLITQMEARGYTPGEA